MRKLCDTDGLEVGSGLVVEVDGREVAVLRHEGGVHAWLNVCPHQGRGLDFAPDQFLFTPGGLLVCPHHGACFDPASGDCLDGPCRGDALTPVAIRVQEGTVWLEGSGGPATG